MDQCGEPQLTTSPDQEAAYPVIIDGAAYRQQAIYRHFSDLGGRTGC